MLPALAFRFRLLLLLCVAATAFAERTREPIVARNFDFDATIAFVDTPIYLFKKGSSEKIGILPAELAKEESDIGVRGKYADYELSRDPERNSFSEFQGDNFLKHLRAAVEGKPASDWQGPAWKEFVEACNRRETVQWVTIITAREHERGQMMAGLKYLQSKGLIRYLPRVEHVYPVGNPKHRQGQGTTPAAKAETMKLLLNRLSSWRSSGGDHVWTFSDDDIKNIDIARQAIKEARAKKPGRWGNVKILLSYVGQSTPEFSPFQVVIEKDGSERPARPGEWQEAIAARAPPGCAGFAQLTPKP